MALAHAPYPLTTVDLGYARLGYFAAHLLLGDVPVRTGRLGNLASRPYLSDRGSLGPARSSCASP